MLHNRPVILLLSLFFIIGCGRITPKSSVINKKVPRSSSGLACYLGVNADNSQCLATYNLEGQSGYEYLPATHPDFPEHLNPDQYHPPQRAINISEHHINSPLAPHFIISEFLQERKGLYGVLSPLLIQRIEELRALAGSAIYVTSGYRSPGYNSTIEGAARWSRHMYGDAIDFATGDADFEELKEHCLSLGASFYQIYKSHIHCDWRNSPLDSAFYDSKERVSEFKSIQESYALSTFVSQLKSKRKPILSVDHPPAEDGTKDLVYSWKVILPSGKVRKYQKPKIKLPAETGQYKTQVTVGGSVTVNYDFYWSR